MYAKFHVHSVVGTVMYMCIGGDLMLWNTFSSDKLRRRCVFARTNFQHRHLWQIHETKSVVYMPRPRGTNQHSPSDVVHTPATCSTIRYANHAHPVTSAVGKIGAFRTAARTTIKTNTGIQISNMFVFVPIYIYITIYQ